LRIRPSRKDRHAEATNERNVPALARAEYFLSAGRPEWYGDHYRDEAEVPISNTVGQTEGATIELTEVFCELRPISPTKVRDPDEVLLPGGLSRP